MKKLIILLFSISLFSAQDHQKFFDSNSTYFDTGMFTVSYFDAENQKGIDPGYDLYKNIPFRTIAVNPHKIIPGNVLFIPQYIGVKLPDGSYHDGYFFAHQIVQAPTAQSIKIFIDKSQPNPFAEKNVTKADVYETRGTMAKTMRLRFKLQFTKKKIKPTYKMVAAEFTNLMHEGNKKIGSVNDRIQKYSELGRGTPYLIYNLGEGAGSKIDPDPTIDFARTDCMTFCEHTLALAISDNYPEMYDNLQKIRYKKGEIEYTARNHFTIADWLPNNNWLLEDVTLKVGPGLTKKMDKTIDRPTFYKNNGVPEEKIKEAPQKEKLTVDYIPTKNLLKIAPNLKGGEIVSIVTTNPVVVSAHMGIIIRDEWDNLLFRHASSSQSTNEVMDVRFEQIVKSLEKSKSRVGMIFMRAREDFKIPQ
jgi:3D (Asp-Asp-Asp) domain-containing protein